MMTKNRWCKQKSLPKQASIHLSFWKRWAFFLSKLCLIGIHWGLLVFPKPKHYQQYLGSFYFLDLYKIILFSNRLCTMLMLKLESFIAFQKLQTFTCVKFHKQLSHFTPFSLSSSRSCFSLSSPHLLTKLWVIKK